MNDATALPLAHWQNFYVIAGSSAGALTGLQFVVIVLVAQVRAAGSMLEIRAFGTPTVVHFCTALLLSAAMTIPWETLTAIGIFWALCGVAGVAYSVSIFWHARKAEYNPHLEDWIWYTGLPLLAHLAIVAAAVLLWWNANWSLFLIAADTLLFLLLGIHNSWDTVTYIAVKHGRSSSSTEEKHEP